MKMDKLDSDTLRLACYIGSPSFLLSALKTAKKKKQFDRATIIEEIGYMRGFIQKPQMKDRHWYE